MDDLRRKHWVTTMSSGHLQWTITDAGMAAWRAERDRRDGQRLPQTPETAMTDQTVDSTSDARTTNNTMRHAYRVLSEDEKAQMQALKDKGLELLELIESAGQSRELSIAKTKTEEAVMWAVKHVTR